MPFLIKIGYRNQRMLLTKSTNATYTWTEALENSIAVDMDSIEIIPNFY